MRRRRGEARKTINQNKNNPRGVKKNEKLADRREIYRQKRDRWRRGSNVDGSERSKNSRVITILS